MATAFDRFRTASRAFCADANLIYSTTERRAVSNDLYTVAQNPEQRPIKMDEVLQHLEGFCVREVVVSNDGAVSIVVYGDPEKAMYRPRVVEPIPRHVGPSSRIGEQTLLKRIIGRTLDHVWRHCVRDDSRFHFDGERTAWVSGLAGVAGVDLVPLWRSVHFAGYMAVLSTEWNAKSNRLTIYFGDVLCAFDVIATRLRVLGPY